ncbi:hypothetical protein GCU67_08110 [Modestobacter muralis]|uniref:Uncharacterized protein n=1 Tax=Modestobacter muralis TaxID=1608614 RepID=A0A6P0H6G4_9ACTN|nr:hypothetical protein [Modestobacter muralis]NEK94138.1 hypothetical protein [Modestobacter muralis]NEN50905.1 hypothetical protein [Modestobacter muralis]
MSAIPTVDQAAAQAAAESATDSPELRAARAFEPLLTDAYRLAGLHRRTAQDVAADVAAARQQSAAAERRDLGRRAQMAAEYAVALSRAGAVR